MHKSRSNRTSFSCNYLKQLELSFCDLFLFFIFLLSPNKSIGCQVQITFPNYFLDLADSLSNIKRKKTFTSSLDLLDFFSPLAESSIFYTFFFLSILMKSILIEFSVSIRPNSLERFVIVRMGFRETWKFCKNKIFYIEFDTYSFFLFLYSIKRKGKFQDLNRNPFLKF